MVLAMANSGYPLSVQQQPPAPMAFTIPQNYQENGRTYHGFRRGKYMFPCDEMEMDRMDIYHKLLSVARRDTFHLAPLTPNYDRGPRILDLGCGTGIWAIEMADKDTNSEVLGVDLSMIQPPQIPPNIQFSMKDIESPWTDLGEDSWDMIHIQCLNGSISDWPALYHKAFRYLKPRYGWIEHVEIDYRPRCDDGSLDPNAEIHRWIGTLLHATELANRPLAIREDTRQQLQRAGFVDVQEQIIRLPINPWPTDPFQHEVGKWFNLGLIQGIDALTLGPLHRMLSWPKQQIDELVLNTKRDICNRKNHAYCSLHIWIGRRPESINRR